MEILDRCTITLLKSSILEGQELVAWHDVVRTVVAFLMVTGAECRLPLCRC